MLIRERALRFLVILYLHNTIIHRFYPPKYLHKHCFRFPLGHLHVSGEIVNNNYAKFWAVKEVYYGIVQVVQVENVRRKYTVNAQLTWIHFDDITSIRRNKSFLVRIFDVRFSDPVERILSRELLMAYWTYLGQWIVLKLGISIWKWVLAWKHEGNTEHTIGRE